MPFSCKSLMPSSPPLPLLPPLAFSCVALAQELAAELCGRGSGGRPPVWRVLLPRRQLSFWPQLSPSSVDAPRSSPASLSRSPYSIHRWRAWSSSSSRRSSRAPPPSTAPPPPSSAIVSTPGRPAACVSSSSSACVVASAGYASRNAHSSASARRRRRRAAVLHVKTLFAAVLLLCKHALSFASRAGRRCLPPPGAPAWLPHMLHLLTAVTAPPPAPPFALAGGRSFRTL